MYLTAQKMGTAIDMCIVGNDCGLLQQGADITGGYYYKVNNVSLSNDCSLIIFIDTNKVKF